MAKARKPRAASVTSRPSRPLSVRLPIELLESRDVPSTLEIQLIPDIDQFGNQYATVQVFHFDDGQPDRVTFGIFDTGASPVTYSAEDQMFFGLDDPAMAIPLIDGATVTAEGIGGSLTGLLSQPGTLLADGFHALDLDAYLGDILGGGNISDSLDLSQAASVDGVQAMIGTDDGSPDLPTITGTPIMNGSLVGSNVQGVAALIDQYGYTIDFGALFPEFPEFQGLVLSMPDLFFVEPGTQLTQTADTTEVVRLPVTFLGTDNHLDPGETVTESYNPGLTGAQFTNTAGGATLQVGGQTLLFDTGAQLSVISTDLALALGLDLDNPDLTIDVGGAGGSLTVGGYVIDSLSVPRDDNNDGVIDGELVFTDVPVFVLDVGAGIDGIFGMNLLNPAAQVIYDPVDPDGATGPAGPSIQMTFSTADRTGYDDSDLGALGALFPSFAGTVHGQSLPGIKFNAEPTIAADQPAVTTNEGQPATNTGTFADIDADTVTLTANVGTVTRDDATGTWSWSRPTTDGPNGPISVTITADDGNGGVSTATFTYSVTDVAPTIALAGGGTATTGVAYALTLGAVTDPGTDTVSAYRVNWGDGTSTGFVSGSPAGRTLNHTYSTPGARTITVDLINEDGTHAAAGNKTVNVKGVVDLKVKLRGTPATVATNGIVKFTFTVTNLGTAEATNSFVVFNMPTGMRFVAGGSTTGWERMIPRRFRLDLGTLDAGETMTVVFRARVTAQFAPGTQLLGIARIGDDGLNGADVNATNNVSRWTARVS